MMIRCPIHGPAGVCMFSPDLLELQADGTLPDIVVVEVGDYVTELNFFRFNVSPAEAAKLPIVNGCIPFDLNAAEIMDGLKQMCGFCFGERRKALESHQMRST